MIDDFLPGLIAGPGAERVICSYSWNPTKKSTRLAEFREAFRERFGEEPEVYLAKRQNDEWKFFSRKDLKIPTGYIPSRDRVSRPSLAAE